MKKTDAKASAVDSRQLYDAFVAAAENEIGPKDSAVLHPLLGFDFGGPPDLLRFRKAPGLKGDGIYYVTSDLIFHESQPPNSLGKYELAMCAEKKDEKWAHAILSKLASATMEEVFDVGHTVDISIWVDAKCQIKGLLLTKLFSSEVKKQPFGTLLCTGLTRAELDYALEHSKEKLLTQLKATNIFPLTDPNRPSII